MGTSFSQGHYLAIGLVPLQIIFNYKPLPITIYFTFLNVLTGCLFFILVKKLFGYKPAIFSLILFLFNDYMIYHSLFIWILNYLPLIGILTFYFGYLFYKRPKPLYSFLLGLLSGIGINFQYLFIPLAFLISLFVLWRSKDKIKATVLFLIGGFLGNFPMVLFDLRHDFYHLKTLINYSVEVISGVHGAGITYYHFLHFWPILALFGGLILSLFFIKNKKAAILLTLVYVALNLVSPRISFKRPVGMPEGLIYSEVIEASEIIAEDVSGPFNVVALLDFDTRGFILRYPLEFIYDRKPLGVEEYPEAKTLYVLADKSYNFDEPRVWELEVMKPYSYKALKEIDNKYAVFKITNEDEN